MRPPGHAWWYSSIFLAPRRLKQENCKFEAMMVSSKIKKKKKVSLKHAFSFYNIYDIRLNKRTPLVHHDVQI
jgi:hypothetical protein